MINIECKAILFDLDGTLVDTGSCIENLWTSWAQQNHIDANYVLSIIHGRTIDETLKLISPYFCNQDCIDEIKKLAIEAFGYVKSIPGAIEFMDKLPEGRFAIVTSGAREVSMRSITSAGIHVPDVMITAEDITHGKPDPEPYLQAALKLGVLPSDCLVFEDAESGIRSAIDAGMRVVVVGTGYHGLLNSAVMQLTDYSNIQVTSKEDSLFLSW